MKLRRLALKDKKLFNQFLSLTEHNLSVYAFQNIFIWGKLYDITWILIHDNLCIFFRDKIGCFLYLPPLGYRIKPDTVTEAFRIMNSINHNKDISRIENIEEQDLHLYRELGYECTYKSSDYVCVRSDLAGLRGDKFKSKRSSYNYFIAHCEDFEYLPFFPKDKDACFELFNLWRVKPEYKTKNPVYRGMIDDSLACLKIVFDYYSDLDMLGRLVKIDKQIKAFSFGYRICRDIFCILYEITDLTIKGLAQFIFRRFCSELEGYRYINIMDDSGLENLKEVKLSYRPVKLIPAYIATSRKHPVH